MKAMYSAASGMRALQTKIDTISNNLANVNTTGFKAQRMEFKDILYEKVDQRNFSEGEGRPVALEIGHGVMTAGTVRDFTVGSFQPTENDLDFAIEGEGFFVVNNELGNTRYTKDGSFKLSVIGDEARLVTTDGYYLQGQGGDINIGADVTELVVDKAGVVKVKRGDGVDYEEIDTLELATFVNPAGLTAEGENLFAETPASGPAMFDDERRGEVWQGFLESSNVQVVEEMVNMITAQRSYEFNSKTIQTVDRMLEVANSVKR